MTRSKLWTALAAVMIAALALPAGSAVSGANYISEVPQLVGFQSGVLHSEPDITAEQVSPTQVNLSWPEQVTNCANGTTVLRLTRNGVALVDNLSATATSYVDSTVTPGTYAYEVRQICYKWVSPSSDEVHDVRIFASPSAPNSVTATLSTEGVTLDWQYTGEDLSTFLVQRAVYPSTSWVTVANAPYAANGAATFLDTTVDTSISYNYRIVAMNPAGTAASVAVASTFFGSQQVDGDYSFDGGAGQTITIPRLVRVVSVNPIGSGTATYTQSGDTVTLSFVDGSYIQHSATGTRVSADPLTFPETIDADQDGQTAVLSKDGAPFISGSIVVPEDTKFVTDQDAADYDDGSYSGTLAAYVASGTLTPGDTKSASESHDATCTVTFTGDGAGGWTAAAASSATPSVVDYDADGYTGALAAELASCPSAPAPAGPSTGAETVAVESPVGSVVYSGTVATADTDTRIYKYQGDVTWPEHSADEWTQNYAGYINDTKYNPHKFSVPVTDSRTSGSNSFPVTVPYNSGGYVGDIARDGASFVISGSYTPSDTFYVTNQTSSYYNSGGYSGSLSSYLYSGSYTPSDSKYVTQSVQSACVSNYKWTGSSWSHMGSRIEPSSVSYNSGGYSGSLSHSSCTASPPGWAGSYVGEQWTRHELDAVRTYGGTVTRPASDTRVYRYQGNVTKPAVDTRTWRQNYAGFGYMGGQSPYYQYSAIVTYEAHN